MEQAAAKTKAGQASPAGTFSMKLGKTTGCGGRSFQPDRKGHAGGQNEAADEGRCEIVEFLMQNSVKYSLYLS